MNKRKQDIEVEMCIVPKTKHISFFLLFFCKKTFIIEMVICIA